MYPHDLTYSHEAKYVNGAWTFGEPELCSHTDMLVQQLWSSVAPKPPEQAELLSADAARRFCGGMSKSSWYKNKLLGLIPTPVYVGGRVYWRRSDLMAWIEEGRPGCVVFEERKELRKKRKRQPGDRTKVKLDTR